jgi:hypothetical protein
MDLYQMVGLDADHTDHKWGWTSLTGTSPRRVREGYILSGLPRPKPLD